ncbi:PepSY domain-containing protein [uncultured Chitinophaga sp.]|uniref:PepSY-associated TM helix domain-containing protein n=1 Tax=uncultured Chitinophaga sp. TaxID=339340 RepID=UPI0025EF181D|nr:PepSY-associated TM helix domain-containing protein [uncultured Chitinophaga sp.]
MSIKKLIGKIHLWLGFASGLVVFVIAITGCILAFEHEIKKMAFTYLTTETREDVKPLPPSKLKAIAGPLVTGKKPNAISYPGRDKSATVMYYGANPDYYYQVFIDPYTGEVKKVWSEEEDFFHFILHGHFYLWLPPAIGQPVVATATLVFVIMLISGLVLWWPKNKSAAKQRFSVKWKAQWRRLNYDLHNVLGFYMMAIGFVLAFTGLVWGFEWFSKSLYFVTTGGKSLTDAEVLVSDTTQIGKVTNPEDIIWQKLYAKASKDEGVYFYMPADDKGTLEAGINHRPGTYYNSDTYVYDQHTLKQFPANALYNGEYADKGFGDKLRRMNYDIHVGAIFGLPGKIIMFLASLICASMPVTGIYIWWGRKYKSKKKQPVKKMPALAKSSI